MRTRLRGWLTAALTALVLVLPTLSGCGALGPTTSGPVWGLPYKTGTSVTLGCLGLHDDNIFADSGYNFTNQKPQSGTPAFACPPPHVDDPTHANDASLDLLAPAVGVPVIPLAPGTVLIADESCHFVVVDHGNNTWVAYLHIDVRVTVNQQVTRDTVLGTTAVPHSSKCENSNAAHVHFAFINGSGHSGAYVSMVGKVLCGFQVIKNAQYPIGALQEVAHPSHIIAPNDRFTMPDCPPSTSGPTTTSGCPTAHGTTFSDDFTSDLIGQPPHGFILRGASGVAPTVQDAGGAEPDQHVLSFPEVDGQYWDRWALKDGLTLCAPYTITVKMNFQTSGDRAGLAIAWNDANWDRIDIQPNVFFRNIEFRITYTGKVQSKPEVTGSGLNRYSLPLDVGSDYWLRVMAANPLPGEGQVTVYWSTDDQRFTPVVQALQLANLTGLVGMSTSGPNLPQVNFADFQAQQQ